jgi:hypothetical protein
MLPVLTLPESQSHVAIQKTRKTKDERRKKQMMHNDYGSSSAINDLRFPTPPFVCRLPSFLAKWAI